jgi:tRNA (adenine22-N1)-methyltransferase
MDISYRLEKVASKVDKGARVADIGTDHAYIPIYLMLNNIVEYALAMDVRKGPLEIAKRNIQKYQFVDKIETRLSDGLEKLAPNEVDTIIIAGMGGLLVNKILENGNHILSNNVKLILQPQSEIGLVRHKVHELGYRIEGEEILIDEDKNYNIIVATKGEQKYETEAEYLYGKILIDQKNEILVTELLKKKSKLENILTALQGRETNKTFQRINEINLDLQIIEEVLACL